MHVGMIRATPARAGGRCVHAALTPVIALVTHGRHAHPSPCAPQNELQALASDLDEVRALKKEVGDAAAASAGGAAAAGKRQ